MLGILSEFFKFKVVEKTRLGRACVATDGISEGEIICKMGGPLISLKDFFEKYEMNGCTPLQIDRDHYIDLVEPYICFNHSCDPNAGIRNDGILFALKKIRKGEEINYDYSTTSDDPIWRMECDCKKKICRKKIGDFQTIPHERKQFFYKKNAVTNHIKTTYY